MTNNIDNYNMTMFYERVKRNPNELWTSIDNMLTLEHFERNFFEIKSDDTNVYPLLFISGRYKDNELTLSRCKIFECNLDILEICIVHDYKVVTVDDLFQASKILLLIYLSKFNSEKIKLIRSGLLKTKTCELCGSEGYTVSGNIHSFLDGYGMECTKCGLSYFYDSYYLTPDDILEDTMNIINDIRTENSLKKLTKFEIATLINHIKGIDVYRIVNEKIKKSNTDWSSITLPLISKCNIGINKSECKILNNLGSCGKCDHPDHEKLKLWQDPSCNNMSHSNEEHLKNIKIEYRYSTPGEYDKVTQKFKPKG